jgi:hypothetical protein
MTGFIINSNQGSTLMISDTKIVLNHFDCDIFFFRAAIARASSPRGI